MLATKRRRYWSCPRCKHRNEHRTSSRRCQGCGENTKPKKQVPKHARVLQDTAYQDAALLSVAIHGGDKDECACCGRPIPEGAKHERDHGHRDTEASYGKIRGITCYRCNHQLLRDHTFTSLLACAAYMGRAELFHGSDDPVMRSFLEWYGAKVEL